MRFFINNLFLLLFFSLTTFVSGQNTYRDNFSTVAYNNNDGTANFSSNWIEGRDDDSPTNGRIRVVTTGGGRLRFQDLDDRFIYREVPLAGSGTATLTFDYNALERGDESLQVYIWNPGAGTFNLIANINTTQSNSVTYDLTNAEIASNPRLLFFRGDTNWDNTERIFIDNVLFTTTAPPPVVTVNDIQVDENGGTATFTVTHVSGNASGSFNVNYSTLDGSGTAGSDYTSTSGTLNFNGTIGDSDSFTVGILEDTDVETLFETFTVQFTSSSDPSVDISDTAIGSIRDNDAIIISDSGTVNTCTATFLDSGGLNDNYGNNEDFTITLCPDTVDKNIALNFLNFATESGFDFLSIYDGTSVGAPLLSNNSGSLPPFTVTAKNNSGCLTVRFTSDGIVNDSGFRANIVCVDRVPVLEINDISVDEDAGTATFTVSHEAIDATAPFSVTYETVDGSATSGLDYTAITNGTLNFSGTVGDTETITVSINDDTRYGEGTEDYSIVFLSSTDTTVDITDIGTGAIVDNDIVQNDVPLSLYDDLSGNFDYAVTGGSLRTQDNNTDACAIANSSSGVLTSTILPAGKTVAKAYLYWSHSSTNIDQDVTLEGTSVSADLVYGANFGGFQFYGYIADVTDVVSGLANPWAETYDFSGLTVDNGAPYCGSALVLGAWSLMIFYEDITLPSSTLNLYYGFDVTQNSGASYTLDNFFAISPTGSKATFLTYEGDATLDGTAGTNKEELSVQSGSAVAPSILSGDGAQTGNNPFNSTIYDGFSGTNITTAYGLDLDTYDISSFISTSDTQVTVNVDMGQDLAISSAVIIKVPSNLISGTVFEDTNYPGGLGRNQLTSSGIGVLGTAVELYNNLGILQETTITDIDGEYDFGGMSDGIYRIRVVNSSVKSNRTGGDNCTTCYGVQTYRSSYDGINVTEVLDEVGGANPNGQDAAAGTDANAQTISSVSVFGGGTGNIDFGFNFNTIVNTNEDGQGSLEQFIVNTNNLEETYGALTLDIEANSIFDPALGEDTSIFMIPPTGDSQGRTADANFSSGIFDIFISNGNPLTPINGNNTSIDGRTQTAYSGNTNAGTIGSGGSAVGTSGVLLPDYDLPEIQVHRNGGDVFRLEGDDITIRNLAIYANNNAGVRFDDGDNNMVTNNLLGVNASGANAGNIRYGIEVAGANVGDLFIDGNYIATNTVAGIFINGGSGSKTIQNNHVFANGNSACDKNIDIQAGSAGVLIQANLIENSESVGINSTGPGNVTILENSITGSGQNGGSCSGDIENFGVRLAGGNSSIQNNIIFNNGGTGLVLHGSNTSGNLISRNSFYNNGTAGAALGIDLVATGDNPNGVTLNDTGDSDTGANGLLNFPIIANINKSGTNMVITGWSQPGAIIEFFLTDVNEGSASVGDNTLGLSADYGEGQIFIGAYTEGGLDDSDSGTSYYNDADGNTDNTNRFSFTVPLPSGANIGTRLTSTATLSNSTSEFSPVNVIKAYTVITNRRITYRVKKN